MQSICDGGYYYSGKKPPITWPHEGSINFYGMSLGYDICGGEKKMVLKDITCSIRAKEKVIHLREESSVISNIYFRHYLNMI